LIFISSADEDNHMTTISQTTSNSPDLDQKIIRQIEYYFSDVNMIRDKFLQNELIKDEGWIPLSILTTFKRLQSLTTDFKTIMNALKKSFSGLLQLNETENKIRRHPNRPIPTNQAELELALKNRTVFVKGFPKTNDVTLDKLFQFFEKYGSTDNIQMKKDFKSKDFNGLVSVVFPNDEQAREFIENSKQTPIKYDDGSILECSFQDNHLKNKKQEQLPTKSNKSIENLTGALIHLAGKNQRTTILSIDH
jgi:lupus La protein